MEWKEYIENHVSIKENVSRIGSLMLDDDDEVQAKTDTYEYEDASTYHYICIICNQEIISTLFTEEISREEKLKRHFNKYHKNLIGELIRND